MIRSSVGKIKLINDEVCIVTQVGESGCALYGPYISLEPGEYEVTFHVMPHGMAEHICCIVDVLRRGKTIVAEKDFSAIDLAHRDGEVRVRFEVVLEDTYEFRVTSTGRGGLTIQHNRPLRRLARTEEEQGEIEGALGGGG